MKVIIKCLPFGLLVGLFCSCGVVAPVTSQFEKAGTLKKGNFDIQGNLSTYGGGALGGFNKVNTNYGLKLGYGVTDKFDIKFRYERLIPSSREEGDPVAVDYFSVIPKLALIPEQLSLIIPVSRYISRGQQYEKEYNSNMTSVAPQVLYTYTNQKKTVDFSLGLKGDLVFGSEGGVVFVGSTVGAGFSSNLDRWALRPELGLSYLPGAAGAFLNYGVGFQIYIGKR